MKMEEINQLSLDDIKLKLEDLAEELGNLLLQHSTHQLDNPLRIRFIRRDIARLKTVIRESELGIRS
ncbi:50S ribosomal protein L29 [candidate division KSB1 bacterium RBG_16_48_16]|nr:MAG: 50S ribosomal protein L29 [candidate division KSB1 bacterium RBG_16_48_16]